jgi:hypothetical protein
VTTDLLFGVRIQGQGRHQRASASQNRSER